MNGHRSVTSDRNDCVDYVANNRASSTEVLQISLVLILNDGITFLLDEICTDAVGASIIRDEQAYGPRMRNGVMHPKRRPDEKITDASGLVTRRFNWQLFRHSAAAFRTRPFRSCNLLR